MANTDNSEWILLDTDLTTRLAILPVASSHLYFEHNEPGSGEFKISLDSAAAGRITNGMFCQCNYRGTARGGFFVENISRDEARSGENSDRWMSVSGRGALALLDDAIIYGDGTGTTVRNYTDKTKAFILIALIAEAQARGTLTVLSYDFSAAVDSLGVAWTDSESLELNVGMGMLELLRQFADNGIDFDINLVAGSFVLSAYKNGLGSDKSNTLFFRTGSNCEEVYSDERGNDIKNVTLASWNNGFVAVNDPTSISTYRRREEYKDLKVAQSAATATTYAAAELANVKDPQKSISVRVYDGVKPYLFEDYSLGDRVTLDVLGTKTTYRVLGIQADFDGVSYSNVVVEFNNLLREHALDMQRDLDWLMNQWETAHDANQLAVSYWAAIGASSDDTSGIQAMLLSGNLLYVGGFFTKIGGMDIPTENIAVYNIVSGVWSALGGGFNMPGVESICKIGSNIYASGNDINIRKWDGSAWTIIGQTDSLTSVHVLSTDGTDLFIGGNFGTVYNVTSGTVTADKLAKYEVATDTWTQYAGGSPVGIVRSMLWDGATLYVGGEGGEFIKSTSDGATWDSLGGGLDGTVRTIAAYGVNLLAGGDFTNYLSLWDGAAWTDYIYPDNTVYGIAVYLTDIYITGAFTGGIARYSGGAWWQLETGLNDTGYCIALNNDDVYVGGLFTTVGNENKPVKRLAAYFSNFNSLANYLENSNNTFDMAAAIHNAPASAITNDDEFGFWEDVSNALRKITWANVKATLKTYFDTLYVSLTQTLNRVLISDASGNVTTDDGLEYVIADKSIHVGITANKAISSGAKNSVNIFGSSSSPAARFWSWGSARVPSITFYAADGTAGTQTNVKTAQVFGRVNITGYNGSAPSATKGEIKFVATEDWSTSANGNKIELYTTPDGSTTEALVLTIGSDGSLKNGAGVAYGSGDISGTGVVGQVAEFVTDTKTLQAAKIIGPVTNILTITNSAAATLALAITAAKTLTLTAADNYNLTISATGTAALLNQANSFTLINPLTTLAESWIGPSSVSGIYFKNGSIGIGTTNPTYNLHIYGANNPGIVFESGSATGIPFFNFKNATGGWNIEMGRSSPYNKMAFLATGVGEIMTLDPAGNIIFSGNAGLGIFGRYNETYPTAGGGYFRIRTNNTDGTSGGISIDWNNAGTLTEGFSMSAGISLFSTDLKLGTVGNGLYVKEGTNATSGIATLVAGTVVVSTTKVTANSRIQLTPQTLGTILRPVGVGVTARTAGTSFTITSMDITDTSTVAWFIVEPA